MINRIPMMYITMLSVILSGVCNMLFVKTPLYKRHRTPIDMGKCYRDGKRWLGDNKTYIGFASLIIINGILQVILGLMPGIANRSELYKLHSNTVSYNLIIGLLFGVAYMLFELPNSFVKRRLDIVPGKTNSGKKGMLFFFVDQFDSIIGVIIILAIVARLSFFEYCMYVLIGGGTHVAVNYILYKLKIRKNL